MVKDLQKLSKPVLCFMCCELQICFSGKKGRLIKQLISFRNQMDWDKEADMTHVASNSSTPAATTNEPNALLSVNGTSLLPDQSQLPDVVGKPNVLLAPNDIPSIHDVTPMHVPGDLTDDDDHLICCALNLLEGKREKALNLLHKTPSCSTLMHLKKAMLVFLCSLKLPIPSVSGKPPSMEEQCKQIDAVNPTELGNHKLDIFQGQPNHSLGSMDCVQPQMEIPCDNGLEEALAVLETMTGMKVLCQLHKASLVTLCVAKLGKSESACETSDHPSYDGLSKFELAGMLDN
ncbi:hypothetical protein F5J12DRAFT_785308 [Pisolithus orientalis]|uniref:uncharacterized protein n=1 Tax=Pisolithus orientalis TaxID=936130 RepID=UPI002225168D|nr:uncharacterized protein F5J12DRAFT_785308 [Pisolithus orientalis]KAI5996894.1 hypothetical protein F5J12DRAFT_785308 [Pisolithus orientalis]